MVARRVSTALALTLLMYNFLQRRALLAATAALPTLRQASAVRRRRATATFSSLAARCAR